MYTVFSLFMSVCLALVNMYGMDYEKASVMNFTFRQVTKEDLDVVCPWFKEPHVKQWWPVPLEGEDFFKSFIKRIRMGTVPYIVLLDNKPIAYIQTYPISQQRDEKKSWLPLLPDNTIGTDQFIGPSDYVGKGFGALMLKEFITYLRTNNTNITTIVVDPDPANQAAIKCYEKVGFKKIGEFQAPWGRALLMRYDVH